VLCALTELNVSNERGDDSNDFMDKIEGCLLSSKSERRDLRFEA
jgi:hypothetical protein